MVPSGVRELAHVTTAAVATAVATAVTTDAASAALRAQGMSGTRRPRAKSMDA